MRRFLLIFSLIPIIVFGQKSIDNHLNITFSHIVDSQQLTLDKVSYINQLNQPYTISKFKYYISNIQLVDSIHGFASSLESYLIDEENPSSKNITIRYDKSGRYTHIRFIVGVDSIYNCSGAQSGALDPIHAMFWTWNTGYIFLKLEGSSPASNATGKLFEYHIGGYKVPNNCIELVELKLKSPIIFTEHSEVQINILVNVAQILKEPTSIDFSTLPSVTDTKNARLISTNYTDMFLIE